MENRRIARCIVILKELISDNRTEDFIAKISEERSPQLLRTIKEQKILLKIGQIEYQRISNKIKEIASCTLQENEADQFCTYIDFIGLWQIVHTQALQKLSYSITSLPFMTTRELLRLFRKTLNEYIDDIYYPIPTMNESVADYERKIHHQNGLAVDTLFAGLRALNEAARIRVAPSRQIKQSERGQAKRAMRRAIQVSSEVNGLEYVVDSVCYGDFLISYLDIDLHKVNFDYADIRLSLLRELSIRRALIKSLNEARPKRFIHEILKDISLEIIKKALTFYSSLSDKKSPHVDQAELDRKLKSFMSQIDAEDDLLFVSGKGAFLHNYTAGAALNLYSLAANMISQLHPKKRDRELSIPFVSIRELESTLIELGQVDALSKYSNYLCKLPARSHFELARRPFVQCDADTILCVSDGVGSSWTVNIRENLVVGGKQGASYGHTWERFYEWEFEDSNYTILGRNIKLRSEGKIVTDIDLLLKHGSLLLVIQIKALTASGINTYYHWKNRKIVEWGCHQANVAVNFLRTNSDWLSKFAGDRAAREITQIHPVVLTTSNTFDGWSFDGVSVLGEVGRKAITRGAKVEYKDTRSGDVIHTKHIVRPEDLTTDKIIWLLENPIESLIAPEEEKLVHRVLRVDNLEIQLPQFALRPFVESYPAIYSVGPRK